MKASTDKENTELKQRLMSLEDAETRIAILTEENIELKEFLGRTTVNNSILSTVIRKPPGSPYDTLVIDVGTDELVGVGDHVYTLGNVVIGEVVETQTHSSKVRLFSSAGQEFDVLIGKEMIEATAIARGGGDFEVILPRDSGVAVGDPVTISNIAESTFANIASIIVEPARAFSLVLFTSRVNMSTLRWVSVEKSPLNSF
jgi:cell shape-determining protein MreC